MKLFNFKYLVVFSMSLMFLFSVVNFDFIEMKKASSTKIGIEVPILMYHSVVDDVSKAGKYILTKSKFEEDLIYLRNAGYETIHLKDLVDYVYSNKPLPKKPIILTLDDGYYNNYSVVYPLLEKHNMKAVISVVGDYINRTEENLQKNDNYSSMTWNEIRKLKDSGLVEFQNHSYSLHNISSKRYGAKKNSNESDEEYKTMLLCDFNKLQDEFYKETGYKPFCFTYPFGGITYKAEEILKEEGMLVSLSCGEGMNYITKEASCLYMLKRYNRAYSAVSSNIYINNLLT